MIWDAFRPLPTLSEPVPVGLLDVDDCTGSEIVEFVSHIRRWAWHLVNEGHWTVEVVSPNGTMIISEWIRRGVWERGSGLRGFKHGPRLRLRATLEGVLDIPAECLCPPPTPYPWDCYGFSVGGDTVAFTYKRGNLFEIEKPEQRLAKRLRGARYFQ